MYATSSLPGGTGDALNGQAGVGARSLYETPVELTPETHRTATKGLDGWGGLSSLLPALRDANLS